MGATLKVEIGQTWSDRAGNHAVVEFVSADSAVLRYVTGPREGSQTFPYYSELEGDWQLLADRYEQKARDV